MTRRDRRRLARALAVARSRLAGAGVVRRPRRRRRRHGALPSRAAEPDESILGTVEVNGSAEGLPPLPKMGVVPIVPTGLADTLVRLVVRPRHGPQRPVRGHEGRHRAPRAVHAHDASRPRGVARRAGPSTSCASSRSPPPTTRRRRSSSARRTSRPPRRRRPRRKAAARRPLQRRARRRSPPFRAVVPTATTEIRAASHRLVDQLLGALTGRPGGFASQMTYAEVVGRWRRVFADRLRRLQPAHDGPDRGHGDLARLRAGRADLLRPLRGLLARSALAFGTERDDRPGQRPGLDHGPRVQRRSREDGAHGHGPGQEPALGRPTRQASSRCRRRRSRTTRPSAPWARSPTSPGHPSSGCTSTESPCRRRASWPARRSSATRRRALLVVYTVGVGCGRRHHRVRHERRVHPAPHPAPGREHLRSLQPGRAPRRLLLDGQAQGGGAPGRTDDPTAGLFIMPIQRPWLAKKISSEVGESLRWEPFGK